MDGACTPFAGKKITVLGLGLLGRGVGDAEFLANCDAQLVVTDVKTSAQLAESVARLKRFPNIEFHLGGHREEDFLDADLILKAAGVPLDSKEIALAKKNNVPVAMSTALFAKSAAEAGATIVGVTGTRGKSTVAHMIFHSLQRATRKSHLGGNIRGVSTLAMLPEIEAGDICVLELDSWQLQGFGDLKISPHVSVFTNLMPDHQNYYPSMEEYFSDKANIFRYQKEGDFFFVGKEIFEKVSAARPLVAPHVPQPIPSDWKLKIPGEHNRENASFAVAALRALQVPDDKIKKGVESFEGVEGRLQFVREVRGVKIYNDNNATTPQATIAALEALDSEKKRTIVLIAGGADKGLDMSGMREAVHAHCKDNGVVFLAGTGTNRIAGDAPDTPIFDSLDAALKATMQKAERGDIILFSPAFASFGMFKNEYDRNDQFLRLVRALSSDGVRSNTI